MTFTFGVWPPCSNNLYPVETDLKCQMSQSILPFPRCIQILKMDKLYIYPSKKCRKCTRLLELLHLHPWSGSLARSIRSDLLSLNTYFRSNWQTNSSLDQNNPEFLDPRDSKKIKRNILNTPRSPISNQKRHQLGDVRSGTGNLEISRYLRRPNDPDVKCFLNLRFTAFAGDERPITSWFISWFMSNLR